MCIVHQTNTEYTPSNHSLLRLISRMMSTWPACKVLSCNSSGAMAKYKLANSIVITLIIYYAKRRSCCKFSKFVFFVRI